MKGFKLAAVLAIVTSLVSVSAIAAETQPRWQGYYVGVNAGAVNHTMKLTDIQAAIFYATLEQDTGSELTGGLQLGYRRQLDLNKITGVYGVELSGNLTDADFSKEYGSPFALYQFKADHELKNYALLQLLGGIAADKMLLFFAAGLSWTDIDGTITNQDEVVFFDSFDVNDRGLGTALGGGVEYACNDALSLRFKVDVITPELYTVSDGTGNHFRISNSIVQGTIGLNYNFR